MTRTHKDLPPGSQQWAREMSDTVGKFRHLEEVVQRLAADMGVHYSLPQRGTDGPVPSVVNPIKLKLTALQDTAIHNVQDGNVLTWINENGKWEPRVPSPGGTFPIPEVLSGHPDTVGYGYLPSPESPEYAFLGYGPSVLSPEAYGYLSLRSSAVVDLSSRSDNGDNSGSILTDASGFVGLFAEQLDTVFSATTSASVTVAGTQWVLRGSAREVGTYETYNATSMEGHSGTITAKADKNFFIDAKAVRGARCTTSTRPTFASSSYFVGAQVYDTDLGIPIWWNGTAWTNALGTTV